MKLAEFKLTVAFSGGCSFLPTIAVDQKRGEADDPGTYSFDSALVFDNSTSDAIAADVRRLRSDILFEGRPLIFGRTGDVVVASQMKTGDFTTLDFGTIGELWSMPTIEIPAGPYNPCPPTPTLAPSGGRSPFAWGNKRVEATFVFFNRYAGKPVKVFRGWTFQKSNQKDVGIVASFSCVDESLLYSKVPLCYELQPFSGKHRGDVVRDIAALVGIDPATVSVPLGKAIAKPVLLSNASLLPFIDEFGKSENWYAKFDENGKLVVVDIEIQDPPHWVFDASLGAYIYDSFSETLPSNPPSAYYVTGSEVVHTGDGNDEEVTTVTTEELQELYAEECVKVRPSGGSSHLYGDGSYRARPNQVLMPVARVKTYSTKRNGIPVRNRTERYQMTNPKAKDPNWDSLPPGTAYNGAYGNKTFHRDEVESLMLFSEDILDSFIDDYGTLLRQVQTQKGWYSYQHALEFFYPTVHRDPVSRVGVAYMYPGTVMRVDPVEKYQTVRKVTTDRSFGENGCISRKVETTEEPFSPQSRCDISVFYPPAPDPANPPPPIVTPNNPPPPPIIPPPAPAPPPPIPIPPVKTNWNPALSGPRKVGLRFFIDVAFDTAPSLGGVVGSWQTLSPFIQIHGDGSAVQPNGSGKWTDANGPIFNFDTAQTFGDHLPKKGTFHFDLTSNMTGRIGAGTNAQIDFGGSLRPKGFLWASVKVQATISSGPQVGQVLSAELRFDPWAQIPQPLNVPPPPISVLHPPEVVPGVLPSICPVLYVDAQGFVAGGLHVLPDVVLNFIIGQPFSLQCTVTNGTPPYTWSLVHGYGEFPEGISISPTGLIHGTPTRWTGPPTFGVVVKVVDANGCVGYH